MRYSDVRVPLVKGMLLLCLLMSACQSPAHRPSVVGPYWNLVATAPVRLSALPLVDKGLARYSIRFTPDSVYHYVNATEREVVDISRRGGDSPYSYRFNQRNDSLFFDGRKYHIAYLSNDSLMLQSGPDRNVYAAARQQQKITRALPK